MARVLLTKGGVGQREFFVVDKAVGAGLPNVKDDVLLVQFFLRIAASGGPSAPPYFPPGESPIVIDGVFGKQTQTYILFYQNEVNRRQGRKQLAPDGRIDPFPPGQAIASITRTVYTILELNATYRERRGATTRIETDPLLPKALEPSLFIP